MQVCGDETAKRDQSKWWPFVTREGLADIDVVVRSGRLLSLVARYTAEDTAVGPSRKLDEMA